MNSSTSGYSLLYKPNGAVSIVLPNGDRVQFDSQHERKISEDTEENVPSSDALPFSNVYSDRFNGKDTKSQIVFGDDSSNMSRAGLRSTRHDSSFMKRLIGADLAPPKPPPMDTEFEMCHEFSGLRDGYTYRSGIHGRGYYKTTTAAVAPTMNRNDDNAVSKLLHESTQALARASRDMDRHNSGGLLQ